jgi:hypothetical protein
MNERICHAPHQVHEPRRRAYTPECTTKNELELALDRMISSWFRWYWLVLASLLLLGAAL